MAFPPKKKSESKSKPDRPSAGKAPAPDAGPPPPPDAGPLGGGLPPSPMDAGLGGMPPDMGAPVGAAAPPFPGAGGGAPLGPMDMAAMGMGGFGPAPGQGMDATRAMHFGLADPYKAGPPPGPQGTPIEPTSGLPVGGQVPPPEASKTNDPTMGGSKLLQALTQALGGGGPGGAPQGSDIYGQPPGGPDQVLSGIGTGSPQGGLEQILNLLALAQMGVQGANAGQSGIDQSSYGQMGLGLGM